MARRICATRAWKRAHRPAEVISSRPASSPVASPLFQGTVRLANLQLAGPGGPWSVQPADLEVVQEFLALAAGPIARYSSQYGSAAVSVGPPLAPFSAQIVGGTYSDRDLQGWVDQLAQRESLGPDSAIVVLNPPGAINSDAKESGGVGVLGYHGLASIPYSFVNLLGNGFTVGDRADLFAEAVSHEVAEMTVDPRADSSNPEVCDGCGTNCQGNQAYRAFFDGHGGYLTTATEFPPTVPYSFFLSAIARPSSATDCPAPASACAYAPPA